MLADTKGTDWHPIDTVPHDRYVLLFNPTMPRWDGNMDVGKWWGDEASGCFWSCGGPDGGLELGDADGVKPYTKWAELPEDAT